MLPHAVAALWGTSRSLLKIVLCSLLGLSVLEFKHCTATKTLLSICVVITFL